MRGASQGGGAASVASFSSVVCSLAKPLLLAAIAYRAELIVFAALYI
jgi:hypothetical protein